MIVRAARTFAAALAAAAIACAPSRAALVTAHPDPSSATAAIEFWYRAPAAGYDFKTPGIARLALAAAAAAKTQGGSSVSELVNRLGGTLSFAVYPDIAMVSVSVPASAAAQMLRTMRSAYFTPSITAGALKTGAQDSAIAAAQLPYDSERTIQDALFTALFAAGPAHYAPLPGASEIARLTQSDVQTFAARAFADANAVVSLAGDFDPALTQAMPNAPQTLAAPIDSTPVPQPAPVTVTGEAAGIGLGWIGPPISDVKAATAMDFVADYLFDADHGTVPLSLSAQPGVFAAGQFVTLHDPGVLIVTVSGDSAGDYRQNVLDAIAKMRDPMERAAFAAARNAFAYHILSQIQTPIERADSNGWYAAEGNGDYSPGAPSGLYMSAVNSLDPQFVADTVRKYLQQPAFVRLVKVPTGATAT